MWTAPEPSPAGADPAAAPARRGHLHHHLCNAAAVDGSVSGAGPARRAARGRAEARRAGGPGRGGVVAGAPQGVAGRVPGGRPRPQPGLLHHARRVAREIAVHALSLHQRAVLRARLPGVPGVWLLPQPAGPGVDRHRRGTAARLLEAVLALPGGGPVLVVGRQRLVGREQSVEAVPEAAAREQRTCPVSAPVAGVSVLRDPGIAGAADAALPREGRGRGRRAAGAGSLLGIVAGAQLPDDGGPRS